MLRCGAVIASLLSLYIGSGYSAENPSIFDDDEFIFQFDDFESVFVEKENNTLSELYSIKPPNEDTTILQKISQDNSEEDIALLEESDSIQHVNYEAELTGDRLKALSSEKMIDDLVNSYKAYNKCRLDSADSIQSMFVKLVTEERNTVGEALKTLVYDMIPAVMNIESSLASKSTAERLIGLQKVLCYHELEIPKFAAYPIETIIPPRFHNSLLAYYFNVLTQDKLQKDISNVLYVVELLLGTKYATYLEDFWQIYYKEEKFLGSKKKFYIKLESDKDLSFQKILSLRKKFQEKYKVDYDAIRITHSNVIF